MPSVALPTLPRLVELRRSFRDCHQQGDHAGADAAIAEARVFPVDRSAVSGFPSAIREKLLGYGREWEAALAASAVREGFCFVGKPLRLRIASLEQFQRTLEIELSNGSGGFLLFAENNLLAGGIQGSEWHSIWYFALPPNMKVEALGLEKYPGVLGESLSYLLE